MKETAKKIGKTAIAICVGLTVTAAVACASPHERIYVRVGPPAPRVEARVVAPGPGYVWVPGYYVWNGSAYLWTAGRWSVPPRPRAIWVAPHWQRERRGWFFVEGHWR